MGKAAGFLSIPEYENRFASAIGYMPYPGTLNVELSAASAKDIPRLLRSRHSTIKGFAVGGRKYGSVRCYAAWLNGKPGVFIIKPQKSRYPDTIIELVAKRRLKSTRIKLGSEVSLQLGS